MVGAAEILIAVHALVRAVLVLSQTLVQIPLTASQRVWTPLPSSSQKVPAHLVMAVYAFVSALVTPSQILLQGAQPAQHYNAITREA